MAGFSLNKISCMSDIDFGNACIFARNLIKEGVRIVYIHFWHSMKSMLLRYCTPVILNPFCYITRHKRGVLEGFAGIIVKVLIALENNRS